MKTDRLSSWFLALVAGVVAACTTSHAMAAFPRAVAAEPQAAAPDHAEKAEKAEKPSAARGQQSGAPAPAAPATVARDVVVDHRNVTVARGEKVADLVVTFGKARVEGEVTGDVVVVFGNVEMDGEVHGDLFVVFGGAKVSGTVHGDAVAVGEALTLEEQAHVKGDAMALGGFVRRAEGARVDGKLVSKGYEALPEGVRVRARRFFEECVLLARPLSLHVDFVWWLWGGLLAIEALLALLFPSAVRAVMGTMRERPVASVFAGLASIPAGILVGVTLSVTVVLAPVVLFLFAAVCVATALGEASFMRLLGAALLKPARPTPLGGGWEFALGALLLTGLMLVPFLGMLVWAAVDLWVVGAVLLTLVGGRKGTVAAPDAAAADTFRGVVPGAAAMAGSPMPPSVASPRVVAPDAGLAPGGTRSPHGDAGTPVPDMHGSETGAVTPWHDPSVLAGAAPASPSTPPPLARRWHDADPGPALDERGMAEALYPTFGRRLGALLLDWVPLMVLAGQMPDQLPLLRMEDPAAAVRVLGGMAYFATMLAWRGTTLGGLVAGLRVVRVDGRPMDRPTAVVRALAAILSVLSGGLGWMWGSWDSRRQTWHDRIAGTVVVRDDSGRSLV